MTTIIKSVVPVSFEVAAWFGYKAARNGERLDEKRNAAAARGNKVHLALASWASGDEPDEFDYPDLEGYLIGLEKFILANDPEWHDSETRTASAIHRYAGTLDACATFRKGKHKGALVRFDLKTGRVYPEQHFPQLEAYEWAEVERGRPASDLRFVLDVKDTGKYRLVKSVDTFEDFECLLRHYRSVQNRKKKMKRK